MTAEIIVTRVLPGGATERLKDAGNLWIWCEDTPLPRDILMDRVRGAAGLLTMLTDRIDGAVLDAAGASLKVVSNYAVGFDNIDVAALTERGIPAGNTPDVLTETTADLAFSLLMAAARRIVEGERLCREGRFISWSPTMLLGWDIHGATLGILGMGRIGRAVARRAGGFNMKVIYHRGDTASDAALELAEPVGLDELLERSDFLSLHAPLNDGTRHLIDGAALGKMRRNAVIINTARGPVIDQEALYDALAHERIAYAALDVTDPEPLPNDHPLYQLSNCLIVPHLGSGSHATRVKMAEMATDNLLAGLAGEPLPHCINPEVYR